MEERTYTPEQMQEIQPILEVLATVEPEQHSELIHAFELLVMGAKMGKTAEAN